MVCKPQTDRAAKEDAVCVLSRVWPHQALLSMELCPGRLLSGLGKNTFCSVWLFATPWTATCQTSLSFTISWSFLKLMSIEFMVCWWWDERCPSNHLIQLDDEMSIQSSHPLSPPFPAAFNLSQHQGLFQWVGSPHQVTKVLELQLHHPTFQWIFRVDFL